MLPAGCSTYDHHNKYYYVLLLDQNSESILYRQQIGADASAPTGFTVNLRVLIRPSAPCNAVNAPCFPNVVMTSLLFNSADATSPDFGLLATIDSGNGQYSLVLLDVIAGTSRTL